MSAYTLKSCRDCGGVRERARDKGYGLRCVACGQKETAARESRRTARDHHRDALIAARYEALGSGAAVAREIGLSAVRVCEILRRCGIPVAAKAPKPPRERKRDGHSRALGCLLPVARALNDGLKLRDPKGRVTKYMRQRSCAKARGIGWEITFPEWLAIWITSGKWDERGTGAAQYVMARHGDEGPYAPWNVSIKTSAENIQEAASNRKRRRAAGAG